MYRFVKIKISIAHYSSVPLIPRIQKLHTTKITTSKFHKVLVANRGEIACRIIRTLKKLGIRSVAIYSEVDKNSMHTEQADEAYCIDLAPSTQSYLRQDKIISIAKKSKSQAIHPGYGFLSENAEFAELCSKENITFIGPPTNAIKDMGIKSTSKSIMIAAGVPVIAGYHGDAQSNDNLLLEAKQIGFPLMIKAVCGGGGKGMRIVLQESKFVEALDAARAESEKAFGNSSILLEQYVNNPRHIEVQIFADQHGNVVHLFERDCSVQRRHQKIIEEAPAPDISENLRSRLGATAVQAAKAVGYVGAGTVEFLLDPNTNSYYFMEMNTRLQVEHPITEAITGLDLVEWQLHVATGEELPLKQSEIKFHGHAFEARIYAENPREGFLPGAGQIQYMSLPKIEGKRVRIETGIREKDEVSVHYDPMIAKLITWGKDRTEALAVLQLKLSEYNIAGVDTNIEFIKDLCCHSSFVQAQVHTGFIDEHYDELFPKLHVPTEIIVQAALATILHEDMSSLQSSLSTNDPLSPFATETGLRLNHALTRAFNFNTCGENIKAEVQYIEPEIYAIRINNIGPWRKVTGFLKKHMNYLELTTEVNEMITKVRVVKLHNTLHLFTKDREWQFHIPIPTFFNDHLQTQNETDLFKAVSPTPGIVEKLFVNKGDVVKTGDALLVINAMKMEYTVRACTDGVIENVLCSIGDHVPKNKILVQFTESKV